MKNAPLVKSIKALIFSFIVLVAGCNLSPGDGSSETSLSAPTGVTATANGNSITVNWSGVTGATSYNVYYAKESFTSLNGTLSNYPSLNGGTKLTNQTNPLTINNLSSNTKFYFVVTAVNLTGNESGGSSEITASTNSSDGGSLKTGLIAYYPFTSNANDASGNGNHVTTHNGVAFETDGAIFDGINDYMEVNSSSIKSTSFTISFYAKFIENNQYSSGLDHEVVFTHGHDRDIGFFNIMKRLDGTISFHLRESNLNITKLDLINIDYSSHFYNIVYSNGTFIIYIDGILKQEKNYSINNFYSMYFGRQFINGYEYFFNGTLADLSIYNKALTPNEITQLYNKGGNPLAGSTQSESKYCGSDTWYPHPVLTDTVYCKKEDHDYLHNSTNNRLLEQYSSSTSCGGYYKTYGVYNNNQLTAVYISNGFCRAGNKEFPNLPAEGLTNQCKKHGGTGKYLWFSENKKYLSTDWYPILGVLCEIK